jgi:hypothetical protein
MLIRPRDRLTSVFCSLHILEVPIAYSESEEPLIPRQKNRLTLSFMGEVEGDWKMEIGRWEIGAKPIQSKAYKERPRIIDAVNDEAQRQKLMVEKLPEKQPITVTDIEP